MTGERRRVTSPAWPAMLADRQVRIWFLIGVAVALFCVTRAVPVMAAWESSDDPAAGAFADATTYLAAGERLNSGHDLYHLAPGDRLVVIFPDTFTAPFVSPSPIAVLWRPLAAVPFGWLAWIVGCWTVLIATVVYVVCRGRWVGLILAIILVPSIAEQLAVANVASFFPALLILAWRSGDTRLSGASLGLMAAIKLSPVAMLGWLAGVRAWRAMRAWVATVVVLAVIGAIGAGLASYVAYLDVARSTHPSPWSLSALADLPWLSYAVLIGGALVSVLSGARPAASFMIAVGASVFGSPALYPSGLVPLLALAAPFVDAAVDDLRPFDTLRAYATVFSGGTPT